MAGEKNRSTNRLNYDDSAGCNTQETIKSYNQVDNLQREIEAPKELVLDQKEELLNLYRRLSGRNQLDKN